MLLQILLHIPIFKIFSISFPLIMSKYRPCDKFFDPFGLISVQGKECGIKSVLLNVENEFPSTTFDMPILVIFTFLTILS